jgi:hypothetical protein
VRPSIVKRLARLNSAAKTIVMAMLFMSEPFLESDLFTWMRADSTGSVALRASQFSTLAKLTTQEQPP